MQRIIIFDGPDMCGKTNMAKALSKFTGIKYFKNELEHTYFDSPNTSYFRNAAKYIDSYMSHFLKTTRLSVIFDRAWPSEYCYPRVFGRRRSMKTLKELDKRWSQLNTFIIIPVRSSYEGIVDDRHPTITQEKLEHLDSMYREFAEWTQCKTLLLNVDDEDLCRELLEIVDFVY